LKKSTANITFNDKTESFLPKIRNKTRMSLSPLLFNTVLDVLGKAVKQVKLFLFADEMTLYMENSKEYIHTKLLELINKFSTVSRYKINIQNQLYFHTLAINNPKIRKLRKQLHLQEHPKEQNT